jgi:hypothetical protein
MYNPLKVNRRLEETCHLHTLKIEVICSSESSVDFKQITRLCISECRTHNHHCLNLKSYINWDVEELG